MGNSVGFQSRPCRSVTVEEIDHFRELGWVKLPSFIDPTVVRAMLDLARELMGDDADSNPLPPGLDGRLGLQQGDGDTDAPAESDDGFAYFNAEGGSALSNPLLQPLMHEVGRNAKLLQHRVGADGRVLDVRYYTDYFVPKLPSSKASRHGGNGPTAFHQDFISHAVDRSGGMTFWFALEPYGPEAGTMSFVSGSHRAGVLGHYMTHGDGDVLDTFPELRELEMSEPMVYELGDVTVHDHLTVHGAGENLLTRPRWAYIVLTQPEDVCWNGAPCPNFDWSAMRPLDPLGDEILPRIG